MIGRFFIDECLSPDLATLAQVAGYAESTCSRDRNLLGSKDWQLISVVMDGGYTLVTRNARDFRGAGSSAPGGLYARQEVHPGLICLDSECAMGIERQKRLFEHALNELETYEDLVNLALEVHEAATGEITISIYEIPKSRESTHGADIG